jgi:protein phosphatase
MVEGDLVLLQIPSNLVIIGDVHGDIETLDTALDKIDVTDFFADKSNKIIFLGDYIDRGSNSIDVMKKVCNLKIKYPHSIILLRGNHEAPVEFPFNSHDLPHQIIENFGLTEGRRIYTQHILPFFGQLSLAVIIDKKLLLVHGGLPTGQSISRQNFKYSISNAQQSHTSDTTMEELLWNDPRDQIDNPDDWNLSARGLGRYFGPSITEKWLNITQTKAVVRGHEPCSGYKLNHMGSIMTIFSCIEAYPRFKAAFLQIPATGLDVINNATDLTTYIKML